MTDYAWDSHPIDASPWPLGLLVAENVTVAERTSLSRSDGGIEIPSPGIGHRVQVYARAVHPDLSLSAKQALEHYGRPDAIAWVEKDLDGDLVARWICTRSWFAWRKNRAMRRAVWSGDWRRLDGGLRLIAMVVVRP